ncbi:MAG TPA: FemAB family XrtA/PEP-CTERM system-associated protein, partial [Planctomycetaceae bacterium]|nr:FemAB family XrtA/PEP-CTERM system-associated protein [Planctomycetaceae bacterium]
AASVRTSHPAYDLRWLPVLERGLAHKTYLLTARNSVGEVVGRLPLALVSSRLFGRFLISLSYVNAAGVQADDPEVARRLIDEAVVLTGELDCRYLELRQEMSVEHAALTAARTDKCLMRMPLPETVGALWDGLKAKVRSQVRKGQRPAYPVIWGRHELLNDFYDVFARNMRDLGTPVFGRRLFQTILDEFGADAELCVIRDGNRPIAGALLVHGREVTEVPSASALNEYRPTNVNMLMYWHLLARAVERGSGVFDFGRSTRDGSTYQFKKQWGAEPHPSTWQYHVRHGSMDAMRPDQAGNRRLIAVWKRLPVWFTRLVGPSIVRGIP